MFSLATPWWELAVRSIAIYLVFLIGLRLFGKREVGQFTLFDLVFIILVGNALQPAMTGPDSSLLGGLIIMVALFATNRAVSMLDRTRFFHRWITPDPSLIVKDGHYLEPRMRREGVTVDDVQMAMREHGIDSLHDVRIAVLESDGSISIVPSGSNVHRSRHKARFIRRAG